MMVGLIITLIIFSGFLSFISFGEKHFAGNLYSNFHKYTFPFMLVLGCWFFLSANTSYSTDDIKEKELTIETKDNVQIVTYDIGGGNFITRNLNSRFGRVIDEENDKIILKTYKSGWYFGIYWGEKQELELKEKE